MSSKKNDNLAYNLAVILGNAVSRTKLAFGKHRVYALRDINHANSHISASMSHRFSSALVLLVMIECRFVQRDLVFPSTLFRRVICTGAPVVPLPSSDTSIILYFFHLLICLEQHCKRDLFCSCFYYTLVGCYEHQFEPRILLCFVL